MEDRFLDQLVSRLTREDMESATGAAPPKSWFLSVSWSVIRRLSRSAPEAEWPQELHRMAEDLVTALYGLFRPWMFLLHSRGGALVCAYGSESPAPGPLPSLLRSAFSDASLDRDLDDHAPGVDADALAALSHAVALTGIPTMKRSAQIDRLCEVLRGAGGEWAYLLRAEPVSAERTRGWLRETRDQLVDVASKYGSAGPAMRVQGDRVSSLLEAALKRFEKGRVMGLWRCSAWLLAEHEETCRLGAPVLRSAFSGEASVPAPVRTHACEVNEAPAPAWELLDSSLCGALARPPLEDYPGYEVLPRVRFGLQPPTIPAGETDRVRIASILNQELPTGQKLEIARLDLTKHALVSGVTGSGKTTTCIRLLKESRTPFLVIEPAKSEYRDKLGGPGVMVFTAGNETDSPLRLNPLEVPEHTLVQTHIDYLKALFMAAFVLYSPMPQVLEISLQQVYEDCGWNLATNENSRGQNHPRRFPRLSELIEKVNNVAKNLGYSSPTESDIKGALTARLESLRSGGGKGPMFDVRTSVPEEVLFGGSCILEMKEVSNDDEKAFLIGLVLMRLYEYLEGRQAEERKHPGKNLGQKGKLRHLTLIEEAHRLLRNTPPGQGDFANPKGQAVETFSNMLAEIRAYGEGIVIAEQLPSKLAPDVIKNTNLKIVHRMVAHEDRVSLGAAINLPEEATSYMTRLLPGRAMAYAEGLQRPVLVKIDPVPMDQPQAATSESPIWKAPPTNDISWVDRLLDVPLNTTFRRLFNSLRRVEPHVKLVTDALTEFTEACGRTAIHGVYETAWWSALVEREVVRRGNFYRWPHQRVDEVIQKADAVFRNSRDAQYAIGDAQDDETVEKATEVIRGELDSFSRLWRTLSDLDEDGPFPGCVQCDFKCHFRFDMDTKVEAEETSIEGTGSEQVNEILIAGLVAAREWFPPEDTETLYHAALCFAAQQFGKGRLGVRNSEWQSATAGVVKDSLDASLKGLLNAERRGGNEGALSMAKSKRFGDEEGRP